MTRSTIVALGHFLATYESDLTYIQNFQLHRQGNLTSREFASNTQGMFYDILVKYKVIRNFNKGETDKLLKHTNVWLDLEDHNKKDVDGFAQYLKCKKLTRDGTMTSLASKILFLNDPYEILPLDRQAKKSVGQRGDNLYATYSEKIIDNRIKNATLIKKICGTLKPYINIIEKPFLEDFPNILTIRQNRILDKLLWANGK